MSTTSVSSLDQASELYLAGNTPAARALLESFPGLDLPGAALLALCWVREILDARPHGACLDASVLQSALSTSLTPARLDGERRFALGWLHWLSGSLDRADTLLSEAIDALAADRHHGEALYWRTRVRLALGLPDPVAEFEKTLRTLPPSAERTCDFIDLLTRSGQIDRAEGVWRTVRSHRGVAASDQAPLFEARWLIRKGDPGAAERLLTEVRPRRGVVQVERLLLLTWTASTLERQEDAWAFLRQAESGPCPAHVLSFWTQRLSLRQAPEPVLEEEGNSWVAGQAARLAGQRAEAQVALQIAAQQPAIRPFARYALAHLGEGDFASLGNDAPGFFLVARLRAWLALDGFLQRRTSPGEFLEALKSAEGAGLQLPAADHYRRLALTLKQRTPDAGDLRRLLEGTSLENASAQRNLLRVVVEAAARNMPAQAACELLVEWLPLATEAPLRIALIRHLLRLKLLDGGGQFPQGVGPFPELPWWQLIRVLTHQEEELPDPQDQDVPLLRIWRAARAGLDPTQLPCSGNLAGPVAGLKLMAAIQRGDLGRLIDSLEDLEAWRTLRRPPPRSLLRALAYRVAAPAVAARIRPSLQRWLGLWDLDTLGEPGRVLAGLAGLIPDCPARQEVPSGVAPGPWLLHRAAQALLQGDPRAALGWARRASQETPEDFSDTARAALPELERQARLALLAGVGQLTPEQAPLQMPWLAGLLNALETIPEGQRVLELAEAGDRNEARKSLSALAQLPLLPSGLAHGLAVLFTRAAQDLDAHDRPVDAIAHWSSAWHCWLRVLSQDHPLFEEFLDHHRARVTALLVRGEVESARALWEVLSSLSDRSVVERFRASVVAEMLTLAREVPRHADVPAGWKADHEKGLTLLVRLLSLDPDQERPLRSLVSACNDWFHDCAANDDLTHLAAGTERYAPFAARLARRVRDSLTEESARADVAEFLFFRGLVALQREHRISFFREVLELAPGHAGARRLLTVLEQPEEVRP